MPPAGARAGATRSATGRAGSAAAAIPGLAAAAPRPAAAGHPLALFIPAGALLNFGLGLALPTVSAHAVTQSSPHIGSGWGLVGCSQQVLAAISVQALGLFRADSPYPVLSLCTGSMLVVLGLEYWRSARASMLDRA